MMQKYGTHISLALLFGLVAYTAYSSMVERAEEQALAGGQAESFNIPVLGDATAETGPQDFLGDVILVDFWATYCQPCRDAMPAMQSLHERYQDMGFQLLSVNVDDPDPQRRAFVTSVVRGYRLTFPVLLDPGFVSRMYSVQSIPHLVLIDRDGMVRYVHRRSLSEDALADEIESLMQGS